jgi:osmoprotectant transport system ATP-binding protein
MHESDGNPVIEFRQVSYRTPDGLPIISDLNLQVHPGEVLVLLGRTGSGKTTALRLINGLLLATEGEVRVEGRAIADWDIIRLRRRIGYAIQEVGLLPHLTVEANIGLAPRLENWPEHRGRVRVDELMYLLGLGQELRRRFPHELSGGQRQRVGLARALALNPPILLMDEPFGSLDPLTRTEVRQEFKRLQQGLAKTAVFVTHDLREALLLGSRIAMLDSGKLLAIGTPAEFLKSREPLAAAYMNSDAGVKA